MNRGAPPGVRLVPPSAHRIMPWKNGFGTTTEIAIDPPDADIGGRFRWRLSIADVARSGPFSAFPGYERTIMVIAGGGMELAVGDRPAQRLDRLFEPFAFSGDSLAECRLLQGPIRDFNLMVERSSLRSKLQVLHLGSAPHLIELPLGDLIVHCFDGVIDLAMPHGEPASRLQPNWTAILSRTTRVRAGTHLVVAAASEAKAAVIALTPP